jgi:hypothetical protein
MITKDDLSSSSGDEIGISQDLPPINWQEHLKKNYVSIAKYQ